MYLTRNTGVNWPGAADVMIPEGLQYQSISKIVSDIKSVGFNAIRLTFAIQMVDDILDNGGDVTLSAAFTKALGSTNGPTVYNKVLKNNPSFSASTTRLQVSHFSLIPVKILMLNRCLTPLLQSATNNKFTFTSITTCPRESGAARRMMEIPGLEIHTSMLQNGNEGFSTWSTMYVLLY
jgi:hypothetical protein